MAYVADADADQDADTVTDADADTFHCVLLTIAKVNCLNQQNKLVCPTKGTICPTKRKCFAQLKDIFCPRKQYLFG